MHQNGVVHMHLSVQDNEAHTALMLDTISVMYQQLMSEIMVISHYK